MKSAEVATQTKAITVSEYASQIGQAVRHVGGAVVEGEVQKPKRTARRMLYFDLTDGDAKLSCKVFDRQVKRLAHVPKEGDLVRATVARPDFWPAAGKLDLVISDIELAGEGELLRRRAQLLARLRAEGLCDPDRYKRIPAFPRAVGVIAGKGSDGMSDVIQAIRDRFPPAHIVTCDALVQGKSAPRDLIDALAQMQTHPLVDVIIIARGGGSVQDLIAFDDERLCRAIFACDLPVVAAIGHTDNVPVCNHITHAAFTPSRSAEMVVPSIVELRQSLTHARQALDRVPERIEHRLERLQAQRQRLRVPELLAGKAQSVREFSRRIEQEEDTFFVTRERGLADARAALATGANQALLSLASMERGLAEQRPRLSSAPERFEFVAGEISARGHRLRAGIARQLGDHERDYRRAIDRLVGTIRAGGLRRIADELERVGRSGQVAGERIVRRVEGADRELKHVTALIAARDFRERGFVLATDAAGRPVPSVAGLEVGARLNLNFRDGQVGAAVDTIKEKGQ
ncbi:MAG TPA: exodeoxyribonuclease VII large subunit [Solirubrobacterales bacterium]|nr:exodeoxyribonuclease VII large subunit [Solirubrobacterales bacterium]